MSRILNSLWIIFTFTYFTNWIAFFYIGFTAKYPKWILYGVIYLIPFIGIQYIGTSGMRDPISNTLVTIFMIIWIVSIIHAIAIRGDYLTRLEIIKKYKSEFHEEYLSKLDELNKKNEKEIPVGHTPRIKIKKEKKSDNEVRGDPIPRIQFKSEKPEKEAQRDYLAKKEIKGEMDLSGINMKLTEILSDSLRYPLSNPKRYIVLGVLLFFSFLIIPGILAYGYMLRIIKHSFNGSDDLPPFNEWVSLFTDGLKYVVVNIVYFTIPLLLTVFISILIIIPGLAPFSDFNTFLKTFVFVVVVTGLIIMTIPYLLSLIALPHIVKKDRLESFLEIKNILEIIRGIGWIKYIAAVVLLTLFSILISVLSLVPQILNMNILVVYVVSAFLGLFIGSYLLAFRGRLLALLYQAGIK